MADDLFPADQYSTVYGLGFNPPTYSAPPDADLADPNAAASDPLQANALYTGGADQGAPPPAPPAPSQGGGSGFLSSILPSWLGGTSGEPVAGSALPRTTGLGGLGSNTMVGLGLGLLGGNRLDPYGRAIAGYQAGARADIEARRAEEAAQYHQSDIGLRKQQLKQAREIAYKPQLHFGTYENSQGLQTPYAVMWNPSNNVVRNVPLDVADKIAGQGGVGTTLTDPFGQPYPVGPNDDVKVLRRSFAQTKADIAAGKVTPDQARAQLSAGQMNLADKALGDGLDKQGTEIKGRLLEGAPGGPIASTVARTQQSKQYREFADNRDAWITGLMTRRGLNAANPEQRRQYDDMFFPQPRDDDATIEAKRARRAEALKEVRAASSPGYRGPPSTPQSTAPATGGATHMLNGRPIAYDQGRRAWIYTDSGAVAQ